jgi:hypothetical protein
MKILLSRYQLRVVDETTSGFGLEWLRSQSCEERGNGHVVVLPEQSRKSYGRRMARWAWRIMESAGFGENLTVHAEFVS